MALNLLGASNARVDFGDLSALSGLTSVTFSFTINASSIAHDERFFGQWGAEAINYALLCAAIGTDEIGFVVSNGSGVYHGRQTLSANLATGTTYRVVVRWRASAKALEIWINGVNQTVTTWVGDGAVSAIINSAASLQVGHETASAADGVDGDYAEFAIHNTYMPDDYCIAYGKGYSPAFYRANGILYAPLIDTSSLGDLWGGVVGANTAGTSAAHPPTLRPTAQIIQFPSAAGGVQSGAGSSAGSATASAVGASTAAAAGTSDGVATAAGVGASTAEAVGTAAGTATASAVGDVAGGVQSGAGTSAGTSTASGVGASTAASVGTAAGTSTAAAVGSSSGGVQEGVGTAAGQATAAGVGASTAEAVGTAAGSSTASAVGTDAASQIEAASLAGLRVHAAREAQFFFSTRRPARRTSRPNWPALRAA